MEERNSEQRRSLESYAQPDTQVTVLDLVDGARGDTSARSKLILRPAALTPREPDMGTQQSCRLNGVRRVWARTPLSHEAEL